MWVGRKRHRALAKSTGSDTGSRRDFLKGWRFPFLEIERQEVESEHTANRIRIFLDFSRPRFVPTIFCARSIRSQNLLDNRTNRRRSVGISEDALSCLQIQTAKFVFVFYDGPGRGSMEAQRLRLAVQRGVSRRNQCGRDCLNLDVLASG